MEIKWNFMSRKVKMKATMLGNRLKMRLSFEGGDNKVERSKLKVATSNDRQSMLLNDIAEGKIHVAPNSDSRSTRTTLLYEKVRFSTNYNWIILVQM